MRSVHEKMQDSDARVLLLACGALAKEILTLLEINNWNHMELRCLPAQLHLTPEKIPAAVEEVVLTSKGRYDEIFVVYADCGTGGALQSLCEKLGVRMVPGPHCYSFFDGNEAFLKAQETEFTSFFLTDFLVRQFDAFVWRPMGLDRHPELRDVLFGNYTALVYLAQTDSPELDELAQAAAKRLGLAYSRRFTGYGDLATELSVLA